MDFPIETGDIGKYYAQYFKLDTIGILPTRITIHDCSIHKLTRAVIFAQLTIRIDDKLQHHIFYINSSFNKIIWEINC